MQNGDGDPVTQQNRYHTAGMSNDEQQRLSEEMPARLWQRAAELQVEAARRAEARSLLPDESETSDQDTPGYALAYVRQAAEEAGIAGEFVDVALAEVAAGLAVGDHKDSVLDKIALRLLESHPESLEVRLDVPAMTDRHYTRFEYDLSWPGIKQLVAAIHGVDDTSCEVVVRGSLRPGRRIAGGIFGTVTAGASGVGALAGGVGLGVGTLGLVPLVAGFGLLGGASLAGASRALFRKVWAFSMNRAVRAMEGLLGTLNAAAVSDWGTD